MSYLVFALKWRPQRFADVTGQGPVSRTLSNALKTGRAAHAYLFTGPRGVGKTTMARILAKALNCEKGPGEEPCNECLPCREITLGRALDVIEIDGASNRGIDDIRELREAARYSPAMLRRKVYIIDEVHMLTQDAFNALLKTLEEPPAHVVFIMATTEPLKVPQTILSRCQRFDFGRLTMNEAAGRLRFICDQEGIEAREDALLLIARKGDGSMRDALTLLDQVVATGMSPLTAEGVRDALGIAGRELYFEWSEAIAGRDPSAALRSIGRAVEGGANLQELAEEFMEHLRNLLLAATDPSLAELIDATEDERGAYLQQAARLPQADLLRYCRICLEAAGQMRRSSFPRTLLEVAVAEMCTLPTALELRRFIDVTRKRIPVPEEEATGPHAVSGSGSGEHSSRPQASSDTAARAQPPLPAPEPSGRRGRSQKAPEALRASDAPGSSDAPQAPDVPGAPDVPRTSDAPRASGAPAGPAPSASLSGGGTVREAGSAAACLPDVDAGPGPDPGPDPWRAILASVASQKPALAAFLNGSSPSGQEGRLLCVRVPGLQAFQREQLERKGNRQFLMDLVSREYGRPLGIRFEVGEGGGGNPGTSVPAGPAPPSGPTAGRGPAARGTDQDGRIAEPEKIRHIADLFGGDIIGPA